MTELTRHTTSLETGHFLSQSQEDPTIRLLILDDDRTFGIKLQRYARKNGIKVQLVNDVGELREFASTNWDVAVIDYFWDDVTGVELAEQMGPTPVVLMSHWESRCLDRSDVWPETIRAFVGKQKGMAHILECALAAARQSNAHGCTSTGGFA